MFIDFKKTQLELLPDRAIFIKESATLLLSDLHLGKTTHFRKSGIPIPTEAIERDYMRLNSLIEKKQPSKIIIIGDLFHSHHNSEWKLFCEFVADNAKMEFILVKGNHDVLARKYYDKLCMKVIEGSLEMGPFLLSHEPLSKVVSGKLNIAGHVHPGFLLQGKGKQTLPLPCFYMRKWQLIMPAFGSLTGLQLLEKEKDTEVYVIANDKVIEI